MSNPSLPPEQRTMVTPREDGHNIEPIPGMGVCDFCTGTPVAWSYPCGPVVIDTPPAKRYVSTDPWGACDECHALIEAGDHIGIVQRALLHATREWGATPEPELKALARIIHDVQRQFHAERLGAPLPK